MKPWQTEAFIILWLIVLAIYAFITGRWYPEASISEVVSQGARNHPLIGVLIGMLIGLLCGHFFWPLNK